MSEEQLSLRDVMYRTPQMVYRFKVGERSILATSVTVLDVDPDAMMVSIMDTQKNSEFFSEESKDFELWALGIAIGPNLFHPEKEISPVEYIWKATGRTEVIGYCHSHWIIILKDMILESGQGVNPLFWAKGGPQFYGI